MDKKEFIGGIHYYLEDGKVIFTEKYHIDRGQCCKSSCRHCPWRNIVSNSTENTTGSLFINE